MQRRVDLMTFCPGNKPNSPARERLGACASRFRGFTLLELLLVISIIAIAASFIIPALGTGSGRGVDVAARQLMADIENARLTAVAERTRTRILLPTNVSQFSAVASGTPWPTDIALRGYVVTTARRTDTNWVQRGKWTRFPQGVAIDFANSVAVPTPSPAPMSVDIGGSGTASYTFNGPCLEFLANGSASLDPASTPAVVVVADGAVGRNGTTFIPKNRKLHFFLTVDPLTGATILK